LARDPGGLVTEERIKTEMEARFDIRRGLCRKKGWDACNDPVPGKTNILVMGDSHASDGLNVIYEILGDGRYDYSYSSLGGCPAVPDIRKMAPGNHPNLAECVALNRQRYDPAFLRRFDAIVLSFKLGWYTEDQFAAYLTWLHENFEGKVIVFGSAFGFSESLPKIYNRLGVGADLSTYIKYDPRIKEHGLNELSRADGYLFLSKAKVFCRGPDCAFRSKDGRLVTYDEHHLSVYAAGLLARAYDGAVKDYLGAGS
jgi:hypothetical protein